MGIKKSKLILAGVLFFCGLFLSVYTSKVMTLFIEKQIHTLEDLQSIKFSYALSSLMIDSKQGTLFLCIQGFITILLVILVMNHKTSQFESPMVNITPNIQTPIAAGQKQHGSAAWLKKPEYKKAFGSYLLDPGEPKIKELVNSGYEDLDFMENKKQE